MSNRSGKAFAPAGFSGNVQALREELLSDALPELGRINLPGRVVRILKGRDSVWALITRQDRGGLMVRACHAAGGIHKVKASRALGGEALRLQVDTAIGRQIVSFKTDSPELSLLRIKTELKPTEPLLIPFLPRDLYVLDDDLNPTLARGACRSCSARPELRSPIFSYRCAGLRKRVVFPELHGPERLLHRHRHDA